MAVSGEEEPEPTAGQNEKKTGAGIGGILRQVLLIGFFLLLIAIFVIAFINR